MFTASSIERGDDKIRPAIPRTAFVPAQTAPWPPPPTTTLPNEVVSATAALFEAGMADPRGCEYREVEVILG